MPIYEYACPKCRNTFEEWLKVDDSASTHPCPHCGEEARRLVSQTTFLLKGGGWYATEYGNSSPEHENHSETETKTEAEAGTANSGESASPAAPNAVQENAKGTDKAASSAPAVSSATGSKPATNSAPHSGSTPSKASQTPGASAASMSTPSAV